MKSVADLRVVLVEIYKNNEYVRRYFNTIINPYTWFKNGLICDFLRQLDKPRILDVGGNINAIARCGIASRLGEVNFAKYDVLDLDPVCFDIELLRSLTNPNNLLSGYNQKRTFIEGDIKKIDLENKYNVVILADVLEHIYDPDIVLERIYQALETDGYLILIVPAMYKADVFNSEDVKNKLKSSHINFFSHEDVVGLIEEYFSIESTRGLSYATGFPYLFYLDASFIPNKELNGLDRMPKITKEKLVKKLLELVSVFDHEKIDTALNNSSTYLKLIEHSEHPLDLIFKCLDFDDGITNDPIKRRNRILVERLVEVYKLVWNYDIEGVFSKLSTSNLYANSSMYILRKK
jgi:SAM-dependent methyltransferase